MARPSSTAQTSAVKQIVTQGSFDTSRANQANRPVITTRDQRPRLGALSNAVPPIDHLEIPACEPMKIFNAKDGVWKYLLATTYPVEVRGLVAGMLMAVSLGATGDFGGYEINHIGNTMFTANPPSQAGELRSEQKHVFSQNGETFLNTQYFKTGTLQISGQTFPNSRIYQAPVQSHVATILAFLMNFYCNRFMQEASAKALEDVELPFPVAFGAPVYNMLLRFFSKKFRKQSVGQCTTGLQGFMSTVRKQELVLLEKAKHEKKDPDTMPELQAIYSFVVNFRLIMETQDWSDVILTEANKHLTWWLTPNGNMNKVVPSESRSSQRAAVVADAQTIVDMFKKDMGTREPTF